MRVHNLLKCNHPGLNNNKTVEQRHSKETYNEVKGYRYEMKKTSLIRPTSIKTFGQGLVEYALILASVAIILILVLSSFGSSIGKTYQTVVDGLAGNSALQKINNMENLMSAYYTAHGSWPRTWSPYNFTDLGLNPADYAQPINGLYISPHGNEEGISNVAGDNIEVYAKDLNGNTVHLINS